MKARVGYALGLIAVLAVMVPAMAQSGYVRESSGRISMNVEESDIRTVLRSISEFSGMNIVAGSEVKGPVTVLLHDVPWRDALNNILRMNDFVAVEDNGIIRVSTHKDFNASAKLEPLQTDVFPVKYARAEKLAITLSKLLTERGKAQADVRANSLIVTDIPRVVLRLDSVIRELDQPTGQVLIEAKIIEVDTKSARELGIDWSLGNLYNPLSNTRAGGEVDLGVRDPAGSFTFGRLENGVELQAAISALEENNKAEILSQPSVLINDNESAKVMSGKRIPINVLDLSGNLITQFYDVAVKLTVTPQIIPGGDVLMTLNPEVSDLSGEATVAGGIIILTSEVNTTLMVKDGETVVIGGVIRSKDGLLERRVPLLHAIPLFGKLFSYSAKTLDKTEILVFVTPRVIPAKMAVK
ncbi:type IV pilus secretin PilQ [candidate division KSB1 bacterium]|nr:type IV pilus secretin PilQ [candidate division KSB1 bacterium]